jgi:hypothetical protein
MNQMAALRLFTIVLAMAILLVNSAMSQQFHPKGPASSYPVENKPKVDEKAYKAALDRIPVPDKPYDPWGAVHASEPARGVKKPN